MHRDYLGSILSITDSGGNIVEQRQFGAWGEIDKYRSGSSEIAFNHDTTLLNRGYTGHEHFMGVGLIHMNGRMYDAKLGRFISPDNFVQEPFNTQSFNRFGYVLGNPLVYVDWSGESFWRSIGNWIKRNFKIITAVVTIAVAVVVTVATAGMASPLLAATIVGASAGFTAGAVGTWTQGGSFLSGLGNGFIQGAIGAASGFVGGAAGQWAAKNIGNVIVNGLNVTSPVAKGVIAGAIGGAAGGYAGGFVAGAIMTGSLDKAHKMGIGGIAQGAGIGGLAGGVSSYISAKAEGVNPWTGKKLDNPTNEGFNGNINRKTLQRGDRIDRYGDETGVYVSPEGTPYNQRSLKPFTDKSNYNSYEVLKPFKVDGGQISPYYFQKGGGVQYILDKSVEWYRIHGYLRLTNGK